MKKSTHLAIFRSINTEQLGDVHQLSDDRLQVFWTLAAAKRDASIESLTAAQIAEILQEVCGVAITRQRVTGILKKAKGFVACHRRERLKHFKLMKRGEDELLGKALDPIFIDPDKPYTSKRRFEQLLEQLDAPISICDPYFSPRTLDYVAQLDRAVGVRFLTENVQDSVRVKRDLSVFTKEHSIGLEVRVSEPGQLHDRYILHQGGMLLVGASLKDLGKKQSIVVRLSGSFAAEMSRAFERQWSKATRLN